MATQKASQADAAKQLLSNLTAGRKPKTKAESKPSRPEMKLKPATEATFVQLCMATELEEQFESRRNAEKELVNSECFDNWVEALWKSKNRPANPSLRVDNAKGQPDCTANFITSDRFTFNLPETKEDETLAEALIESFIVLFTAKGMDKDQAEAAATGLVNNELDLAQRPYIDFFKWLYGHYEGEGKGRTFVEATPEEQALGGKAIAALQCQNKKDFTPLTPDELAQLIETKANVSVKKGFFERVCSYVHSVDQLKAVFSIMKPVFWQGQVKFAVSDTPEDKNRRLLQAAKEFLGVPNG